MTQKDFYDYREDENTRQVSLVRLLRCALMRWKLILLAGVVLGGLMGAYKILSIHSKKDQMIKEYDSYKTKQEVYKASVEQYKSTISNLQQAVDEKQDYIKNSLKMNLDYVRCPESFAELTITGTGEKALTAADITSIMNALYDEVYFGNVVSEIAEKRGMNSEYLREVISVKITPAASVVRVVVRAEDTENAKAIKEELLDKLLKEKVKGMSDLGDFKVTVINEGTAQVFDAEIQNYQVAQNDALTKLQSSLYTAQNQSSGLTKPVAVDQYSKKYMLINGIKLGFVGLAAGMVLALAVIIVMIIRKGVILSPEEIDGEFGLKTLADFSDRKTEEASAIEFMLARLERCMAGKENKEIGIVGSVSADQIEKLAAKLGERVPAAKDDLKFVAIPDFSKDAAAFRKLGDMAGVILTEQIGKSDYMMIRKEIALIAESGRELVGTVYY
ncbi:MAG: hypothetical protein IJ198_12825 [Lachnospiraceae bacterium]|nr:hypothetical protein [Lachnospiraceae bacterium]